MIYIMGSKSVVSIMMDGEGREIMAALAHESSTHILAHESSRHIYEMMARLGIEPGAGVLPRLSLQYATAFQRCKTCRGKEACQNWLDHAPAAVNFAPRFCMNADILFELLCDQPGPRPLD